MSTENGRDIQKSLISYVANFVKIGSGKKFNPHVTIGVDTISYLNKSLPNLRDLYVLASGSFGLPLGTFGTARKELKALTLTP